MEYNSQRNHLILPEYGRNVQKMVDIALKEESRDKRNVMAKTIIDTMSLLNPQLRELTDFKQKLWDHLFVISDFQLDVDAPYPHPPREILDKRPQRVAYPSNRIRFKHYGKNIQRAIEEIKKMEDSQAKIAAVSAIANFMKMSYLNWNRDSVDDALIIEHLRELSDGQLSLSPNVRLNNSNDILAQSAKAMESSRQQNRQRENSGRGQRRDRDRQGSARRKGR